MNEKEKDGKLEYPKIVFHDDGSYEIQLSNSQNLKKIPVKSITLKGEIIEFLVEDMLEDREESDLLNSEGNYTSYFNTDVDKDNPDDVEFVKNMYGLERE